MRNDYVAVLPTSEVGDALVECLSQYTIGTNTARPNLLWDRQKISYGYLFGMGDGWLGPNTSSVSRGGSEGELALIRINHARNYLSAQVATLTGAKFQWQPQPAGYDYQSITAAKRSRQVLDHYYHNGPLASLRIQAWESGCSMGEGFTLTEFDESAGETVIPTEGGEVIAAGDFRFWNVLPWDVIRNAWKRSWRELDWKIVRTRRNRWLTAAKYPNFKSQIMDAPTTSPLWPIWLPDTGASGGMGWDDEDVDVMWFFVDPSALHPQGRQVCFLYDGTVLSDGPLPFGIVPLVRRAYAEAMGTPFGWCPFFDITGIQQAYDSVQSSILTNLSAFGTQYLGVKKGTDPRPLLLGGGMGVFEAEDKGDVWPIQLTAIPQDAYRTSAEYERIMGLLMNTPGVTMGQSPGDRASGSLAALLSASAIQKVGPSQSNDVDALKEQGQIILRGFRSKVKRPMRIGLMESEATQHSRETEIGADDIGKTDRVYIELANPMAQSVEGQMALLEKLAQLNIPVTPEQVKVMLSTGRFEPVTDAASSQNSLILSENELIGKGTAPKAKKTDDHLLHAQRHTEVMSNPAVRDNDDVMRAFDEHFFEHYSLYFNVPLDPPLGPDGLPIPGALSIATDPMFSDRVLILSGQMPPAAMVPPPMPGAGPSMTAPPAPGVATETAPPGNPTAGKVPAPATPPTNPATGRVWNKADGGGMPKPPGGVA